MIKLNSLCLLLVSTLLLFASCKKTERDTSNDINPQVLSHVEDQERFSLEVDAVATDANTLLESARFFSGRGGDIQDLCDAAVVMDSSANPRTITITYNGNSCNSTRSRTGVVIISAAPGVQWNNPGAQLTLTYQNLKVTRLSDNKSITLNGTQLYRNVTGGLLINLPTTGGIIHAINADDLTVTFDDQSQRTWSVAKERMFTYQNGVVIASRGTHSAGGVNNIAEWGTNRFGHEFTTTTLNPVVVRQDCSFRITGGEIRHQVADYRSEVLFGLDSQGQPTTCPQNGSYYLKVTWTGPNNNSISGVFRY